MSKQTQQEDKEIVDKSESLRALIIVKKGFWVLFWIAFTILIGVVNSGYIGFTLGPLVHALFNTIFLFLPSYQRLNGKKPLSEKKAIMWLDYFLSNRTKAFWSLLKGYFWGMLILGMTFMSRFSYYYYYYYDVGVSYVVLAFVVYVVIWPIMFAPDFIRVNKLKKLLLLADKKEANKVLILDVVTKEFQSQYSFQQRARITYLLGNLLKKSRNLLSGWILDGFYLTRDIRLGVRHPKIEEKTVSVKTLELIALKFLGYNA